MVWNWPQITWAVLAFLSLLIAAAYHGEPRTGRYNFPLSFMVAVLAVFLLYMGGFWAGVTP